MKKALYTILFLLMVAGITNAQWTYKGSFPPGDSVLVYGSTHGLAVDPDGKIWVGNYFADEKIVNAAGDTVNVRSIKVFNPDGTEAPFSPIKTISVGPFVNDTLWGAIRGMRADHEGNILVVTSKPYMMYKINYKDGKGLNSIAFGTTPLGENSPTAPAVDEYGNIYVAPVVPGAGPMIILDKDFNYVGNALKATEGFSRAFEVSKDGNTIYWAGYTLGHIIVYHRDNVFADFDSVGTILEGFHSESFAWNPANGRLYLSAGSYLDKPSNGYTPGTWYGYDATTNTVVDSFSWNFTTPGSTDERPRAIGFSPDGKYAYVGAFGTNDIPMIEYFYNPNVSSVEKEESGVVTTYTLSQNYPNPFGEATSSHSSSTKIGFTVQQNGYVTLRVYDVLGREVTTLVNQSLTPGKYSAVFNANNLASGTYIYRLQFQPAKTGAKAYVISKKMVLIK